MKKAEEAVSKESAKLHDSQSMQETLVLELDNVRKEVRDAEKAIAEAEGILAQVLADEERTCLIVKEKKILYDKAKAVLDKIEKEMSTCALHVKEKTSQKDKLQEKIGAFSIESKKLSVKIAKFYKERSEREQLINNLLNKYTWIENDQDTFGIAGGDYDFSQTDVATMGKEVKRLKKEQETLSRKINKKVMGMIEKAEAEYQELIRKRKVVENDKKKIQDVIGQLDAKKKTEIERTWKKVNEGFGTIFSTLLPGAFSKLEPPEGKEVWEGLEVKVAFGGAWKKSLSELSGGQRSLLALSLILSMLLFKPAPMYILDEIDAALDLSHTQNIGNMLKTHFSQSQFIVVSLKEGMFSNANVIFRTKFVNGVSTVSRTLGSGESANTNDKTGKFNTNVKKGKSLPRKRNAKSLTRGNGKEN